MIPAGISGKIKTFSSILGVCAMLTHWHDIVLFGSWFTIDHVATVIMVVTTVWSGVEYFVRNRKLIDFRR